MNRCVVGLIRCSYLPGTYIFDRGGVIEVMPLKYSYSDHGLTTWIMTANCKIVVTELSRVV